MLGTFLVLGVDTLIIVGMLWYVGQISGTIAGSVSAAILGIFALWVLGRWIRLRRMGHPDSDDPENGDSTEQRDPLERLKRRYADGEISEAEFEKRLEILLETDQKAESSVDTSPQRFEQVREE